MVLFPDYKKNILDFDFLVLEGIRMKWECSGTHIKVCVHQIKTDFKVLPLWRNSVPSFGVFSSREALRLYALTFFSSVSDWSCIGPPVCALQAELYVWVSASAWQCSAPSSLIQPPGWLLKLSLSLSLGLAPSDALLADVCISSFSSFTAPASLWNAGEGSSARCFKSLARPPFQSQACHPTSAWPPLRSSLLALPHPSLHSLHAALQLSPPLLALSRSLPPSSRIPDLSRCTGACAPSCSTQHTLPLSSNRMILRFSLQPFRFLRGPPRERAWPLLCSTVSGK